MNVLRHIALNLLKQEKSCKMGISNKRKKCGYGLNYLYKMLCGLNIDMEGQIFINFLLQIIHKVCIRCDPNAFIY